MFTTGLLLSAAQPGISNQQPSREVPAPTPINFPRYQPQVHDDVGGASIEGRDADGTPPTGSRTASGSTTPEQLTRLLQRIVRPGELMNQHFEALGVHVLPDVSMAELIPDMSVVPDFDAWERLTYEKAADSNQASRVRISNGNLSPGVQTYHDRLKELLTPNEAAIRTVRRIQPIPGQPQARLGNAYEFFRNLDAISLFWDDTSVPPAPSLARPRADDIAGVEGSGGRRSGQGEERDTSMETDHAPPATSLYLPSTENTAFHRTGAGYEMPPEYRHNITVSFLKLVAYDFGCNITAARTEPRLYLNAPTAPASEEAKSPSPNTPPPQLQDAAGFAAADAAGPSKPESRGPSSYFSSGCTFIFRTPTTRDAARAGIVEGPLAAVSARHTTSFPPPQHGSSAEGTSAENESMVDLAREVVAALITAQHRAREGRQERRIGEDAWWATKPRWGGGEGGPIGREVDLSSNASSAPAPPPPAEGIGGPPPATTQPPPTRSSRPPPGSSALSLLSTRLSSRRSTVPSASAGQDKGGARGNKSRRTTLQIYDNYRMVRPPSASWDKKTRYLAIGREPGASHDDVFVVSTLFHHIAILRVRVPLVLLDVLDGTAEAAGQLQPRSWGRLEVRRSRWFDFFRPDDRCEAFRLVWAMMAYTMRATASPQPDGATDVKMGGT